MSLFDLTGKVALVTGATKGIGLGIARELAAHGARVIVSSRDAALCEAVARDLDARYGQGEVIARGIACDIGSLEDIAGLARQADAVWDGVDILVCNAAALGPIGPSADTPPEAFDRILSTNIHHNFRLCQAVRPGMAARGGGAMIVIGSHVGHTAAPHLMAYAVAKAGLAHMARSLADELAAEDIRVNCVSPGLIRSASSERIWSDPERLAGLTQAIPLRRIGEPEDIAGAVIFLASRAGSYVTGTSLLVDGGRTYLTPPGSASRGVAKLGSRPA